jgi:UDP-N-acetylmuramate: L-alanyl-gamma-D-glutamyl-meso-diaminopimelate ligase
LAIALKLNGHDVSGSDDEIFEPSHSRLKKYGLLPENEGWNPGKITNDIDIIILGMHARADNPELLKAKSLNLKIYSYPEYLYHHSINKKRVVIGGSHGKTTITAMVMHVLKYYGKNFDYIVGSKLNDFEVMVRLSDDASVMIFEGDEYLSSPIDRRPKFHWYHPHIALLSGIAWDHINVFPTFENYKQQFIRFIELIEKGGSLVYYKQDPELQNIVNSEPNNKIEYIPYETPEYYIADGITYIKSNEKSYPLKIFGKHNLQNLNGAKLVCQKLGIKESDFLKAITSFEGASNRLELVYNKDGFFVFKDFAHAPSKLKATVDAVKEQFSKKNIVACFELHTFSSLNEDFLNQYKNSINSADKACVFFSKHALEMKRLKILNKSKIKESFARNDLYVFDDIDDLKNWITHNTDSNSVLLMMSSGNFNGLDIKRLAQQLSNR